MTLKNILVHIDSTDRCKERLRVAGELALSQDGNVTGLYVTPEPFYPVYAEAAYFPDDLMENFEKEEQENCKVAEKAFREFADAQGIRNEWHSEQGRLSDVVSKHSRYADLTILGKGDIDDPKHFPDPFLAGDVVMQSGRPVLIIPNAGHFSGFGKRILVCWNGSREAVRAVNDAMPFLKNADKVTVFVVNPDKPASGDHGDIPGSDLTHFLARHGIKAEAASVTTDMSDVGEVILSRAFDVDADMIVAGAYGHSRTREWILGGVTKTLIHETAVPAFISH